MTTNRRGQSIYTSLQWKAEDRGNLWIAGCTTRSANYTWLFKTTWCHTLALCTKSTPCLIWHAPCRVVTVCRWGEVGERASIWIGYLRTRIGRWEWKLCKSTIVHDKAGLGYLLGNSLKSKWWSDTTVEHRLISFLLEISTLGGGMAEELCQRASKNSRLLLYISLMAWMTMMGRAVTVG